jgi:wobble nucleotide-excising tRNase
MRLQFRVKLVKAMLRKFISIKNVGRFQNYGASGDTELKQYTLFFAENGRGKTTLSAILRSLQCGDPAYVIGRTTLGGTDKPDINILTSGGNVTFSGGTWSATVPDICIFDTTFIAENVFSGDSVDIDHKRSLYRVIVGKEGVELARQIEEIDAASRAKASEIKDKAADVQRCAPKGFSLETFLDLPEDAEIDIKLATKAQEMEAIKQAERIRTRSPLEAMTLVAVPVTFDIIGQTLEGVAEDASKRIAEQIKVHDMHDRGEAWLSEGVGYIRNDECPFCNQSLQKAATLIDAYKAHFGEAYRTLRENIRISRNAVQTSLGDRDIARIERTLDQNAAAVEFWSRFCQLTAPVDPPGVGDVIRTLREAAVAVLDRKAVAPLEVITPDAAYLEARAALDRIAQEAQVYNEAVQVANGIVEAKKKATGKADLKTVENQLAHLQAVKARHEADAQAAIAAHRSAQDAKKTLDDEKSAIKKKLDEHTEKVIEKYQQTINRLLDEFHAGFRITETKHAYPGGVASSSYQILINGTPVDLGDDKTPLSQPSFKNTLSSGDRSTLALAFFLAQLEHDPDKAKKIVVFDDPFNSQDSFRKDCTVQKIKKVGESCAQVIALSHDLSFVHRIWQRLSHLAADRKCLEMNRIGQTNTAIRELDVEEATQDQYRASLQALSNYYRANEGNPRDVVQKIRPVLETYTRNLGGGVIAVGDTLGPIIGKIRTAGTAHQLYPLLDGLEELNEYTNRYHHGTNTQAAVEPITDGELYGYVRRTLEMVGGV